MLSFSPQYSTAQLLSFGICCERRSPWGSCWRQLQRTGLAEPRTAASLCLPFPPGPAAATRPKREKQTRRQRTKRSLAHVDDTRELDSRIQAVDSPQNKSHDCAVPLGRNTPLVPRCVTRGLSQGFSRLVAQLFCCARAWHCTSSSSSSSSSTSSSPSSSSSAGWDACGDRRWETDSVENHTMTGNIDPSDSPAHGHAERKLWAVLRAEIPTCRCISLCIS